MYVVGSAFIREDSEEDEPSSGRLLLVRAVGGKLHIVSETTVDGGVYCAVGFSGGSVLAAVNSKVLLLSHDSDSGTLTRVCGHYGHVTVLHLKVC